MFSHTVQRSLLMAVILVASSNAISREISYDYIQGTYSSVTDSRFPNDIDGDRFGVSGSLGVTQNLALTAGFNATNFDNDIDTSQFVLGVTLHAPIVVGTEVVGNLSALKAEIEGIRFNDNDTGAIVGIGIRHLVTNSVELDAGISYTGVFDDNFTTFGFGARFYTNDEISFGIGYAAEDDADSILLNARFDI
jgi:hypothetical protein